MINLSNTAKKLRTVGLSRDEAMVYGHLLDHGTSKSLAIQRGTGLTKPLVYRALDALESRQLVVATKKAGAVTIYSPLDPRNHTKSFEQSLRELEHNKSLFNGLIPELVTAYLRTIDRPNFLYTDTIDGVITMFLESNHAQGTIYQFTNPDLFDTPLLREATQQVQKHRESLGTHKILLYPDTPSAHDHISRDPHIPQHINRSAPVLPVILMTYDATVTLISIRDEQIQAYSINDEQLAHIIRFLLQSAWGLAE
jgi:sugar-specific transcriptional regulator TrmB